MSLEQIKKEKTKCERMSAIGILILLISFVLFIPAALALGIGGVFIAMAFFMGGGIYAGIAQNKFKKLSMEFKNVYIKEKISQIFPGSRYEPEIGFDMETVYQTKILQRAHRFFSEDYLSGKYREIQFESADVKLQNVHSSGKTTTVVTVFLGRLYRFTFPKSFPTELILIQPGIGQKWGFGEYARVETESVEFNREFLCFAKDKLDAFRMLLPQFMEKLLEIDHKYRDKIAMRFVGPALQVAINSNIDTLDLKMYKPIDESLFQRLIEEIEDVKSILNILKMAD